MESYLNNRVILGRLIFVLQALGDYFLFIPRFCGVVRRYVVNGGVQEPESNGDVQHDEGLEDQRFACETKGLLYVDREQCLTEGLKKSFDHFHDFTLKCGSPIGTILMSGRSTCRRCNGKLSVDANGHVVVFYHIYFGSYLGSRVKKSCRKCKLYEHYGGWTEGGKHYFDDDCLNNEFLLTSEETAFHVPLLKECGSLLLVGALAFSSFASSYNHRFGYRKQKDMCDRSKAKRMKRLVLNDKIVRRRVLKYRIIHGCWVIPDLFGVLNMISHSFAIVYCVCIQISG
jgi:hypothetical protein